MDATARGVDFPDPRLIYWLDAVGSLAFGIVLVAAATPITSLVGWSLPSVVLTGIGVALLPWALFNLAIARSVKPVPRRVRINIIGDLIWIAGSAALILIYASQLTAMGRAVLIGQALAVSAVMATKVLGARRISSR
ncbi:hypothetical protein [Devosia sp. CAU 1758]